jgi:membrane fusion protein (multidrug efflux system)
VLSIAGCGPQEPAAQAPAAPPAVVAVPAKTGPVSDAESFVGRVVAQNKVELRARVEGFLRERPFTEGDTVAAGDLLFVIEPDQYEAALQQRQADLAKAEADDLNAEAQLRRGEELLKQKNIAASQVDELRAAASIAEAGIAQAKAAVAAAELDVGYTEIKAPIAGRIGLAQYTVGNLVGPASGPLATIVSRDPIYVQFPLTQRDLLQARRAIQQRGADPANVKVEVTLPDDSLYEHTGKLDFVDVTTDPSTDTVTLRAALPNPDGILVDGQYVRIALQSSEAKEAILIPQSALQLDQQGAFVLVVDTDSQAQIRRVVTGPAQGSLIAVVQGLAAGDLVITEGVQKARPGQPVSATPPVEPPAATGQATGAAGGQAQ